MLEDNSSYAWVGFVCFVAHVFVMILTIIFVSDHGVNRDTGMIIFKSVILLGWSIASIVVTSMLLVQTADYNKIMHT